MLYFPQGRVPTSQEYPVAPSASVTAEGLALVGMTVNGVFGVAPSAGASGEKFIGISVSAQMPITSLARVEEHTVSGSNVVTLDRVPTAGTLSVFDVTANAVVPASSTGAWSLAGRTLTLTASETGHEIVARFKYAPTTVESQSIQGDIYPGGPAGFVVGQVGALKKGTVFTSEFDTTINWNVTNPAVKTGAGGQFTVGGNGDAVNCVVVNVPSATSPFLGLNLL